MENQTSPAFRNALGGYKKQDVNEYLLKLNREFDEAIAAKEKEMASVREELAVANAELENQKEKQCCESDLENANSVIAAQNEQIVKLKEEIEKLTADLSTANARLGSYDELSCKLEQYESMTNRMGEIYMQATADAERLRSEAKQTADEIKIKTEKECSDRKFQVETQLREFAAIRKDEISRLLGESQAEIDRVLAIFGEKSRALTDESFSAVLDGFESRGR